LNTQIFEKAKQTVDILKLKNLKIATAESCTGGMLSSYITAVPGASRVFEMGITTYSNRIKNSILKVTEETLKNYGAVSRQTATEMAQNVRNISRADIGVSVTGVAGPDGQDGYSAGVVFIGISNKNETFVHKLEIEPVDRNFIRENAVIKLLDFVLELIK